MEFKPESKIYIGDSRNMKEVPDGSVQLIITSPPYGALKDYENDAQIGLNQSYDDYIKNLNEVWKECIRVLGPDGKLCIDIMPLFESGNQTPFKRRVTHTVISDIEKFMDSTGEMFTFALYIWDKRKIVRFSSFGSYPYPTNIFSTFPYEWIIVFCKKGKREKVSDEIKEKSVAKASYTEKTEGSAKAEGTQKPEGSVKNVIPEQNDLTVKKQTKSIRKCFLITPEMDDKLKKMAEEYDTSENEIINQILAQVL